MDTPIKPAVVDGSNARLYRMVILAGYLKDVKHATLERMQAWMTIKFGLRRRTTTEMISDMQNAHLIRTQSTTFTLTATGEKWLKEMAKQNIL